MTFREVMAALRTMGTAQNVKIYKRHGAGDRLFGVSFANLNKLKKQIRSDHQLAERLWETGNSDARSLALMIADPEEMTAAQTDAWLGDIEYYVLADLFARQLAGSKLAPSRLKKWTRSNKEYVRQCGYSLLCSMLAADAKAISDEEGRRFIATIERDIHGSANRARHAMNMALIAIGIYRPRLRTEAIAAGRRIGKTDVDHGETGCKTPDVESYIRRAAARKSRRRRSARA